MLIIVGLLIVLSLPKVWLKPTLDEREFVDLVEDDVSREKRQAYIFDLIHQAIENYANCAHEHLAPLKALANYKRYETLIYPEDHSSNTETILGATQQQNKGKVKCTKVNLCSLEKQPQMESGLNVNEPTILGKTYYKQDPNFKKNRGYNRLPIYGSNRLALKPKNSSDKNLSFSALNQAFLNKLFNLPVTSTKSTTDAILGSELKTTKAFSNIKSCTCSERSTEKPPDIIEIKDSELDVEQITEEQTSTESEAILGSKLTNSTISGKTKSCGCLKKTTPKTDQNSDLPLGNSTKSDIEVTTTLESLLIQKNKTENLPEPILASPLQPNETEINITNQEVKSTTSNSEAILANSLDITNSSKSNQNCTCSKLSNENSLQLIKTNPLSNQNLNLLVLQLDFKAQNESKENLKKILKDLKALKSAMKLNEKDYNQTEATITTLKAKITPENIKSSTDATTIESKSTTRSDPMLGAEKPQVEVKASSVDLNESEHKNSTENRKETEKLENPKATNSNNNSIDPKDAKSENKTLISPKSSASTTDLQSTLHSSNETSVSFTAVKELSNQTKVHDIAAVKSSPPLQLNITNSQDLERITNEVNAIVSSMANKTKQENLNKKLENTGDHKTTNITIIKKTILNTNNQTFGGHKLNITDPNLDIGKIMTKLNNSMTPDIAKHDVNSTITISISSNGSFKKIEVEHESDKSSNKNVEINEKEKMNLNSPKVRSIDMKGISSRYINHLRTSRVKEPYAEPILSEIYAGSPKLKAKYPLSIFWHTIEKKPQKSYTQNWETFQSNDFEDYDYDSRGDQKIFSSSLEDCEDYEDLIEEIDKREINENKTNKKLCKRNVLIT